MFYVSDIVAFEVYVVIQHHFGKSKDESLTALKDFSSGR